MLSTGLLQKTLEISSQFLNFLDSYNCADPSVGSKNNDSPLACIHPIHFMCLPLLVEIHFATFEGRQSEHLLSTIA